jgi:rhamnose transport system ATP-binding protein
MLLEARGIEKSFSGVRALTDVSFDLQAGEVHALVGENGAGKSTLIKIITGAVEPDAGTLRISGSSHSRLTPATSRALGIAAIYQQPSLFPHLTVAENISIAIEPSTAWRRVNWKQRSTIARDLLDRAGSDLSPDRIVSTLTMPEQQVVEIAKAIGVDAKIVVMDEPTASLTEREVESLFRTIGRLRERGAGIIYISHRLEEISTIADRVTVLRDGERIGTFEMAQMDRARLIERMVGRSVEAVFPKRAIVAGEIALEVRGLSCRAAGVRDISFTIRSGEIFGFAGLVGAGRTQLAETIFGITPPDSGEILVAGSPVKIHSPQDAISRGIGYLPEDRRQHGVVLGMPIFANTSLASLDRVSHRGLIQRRAERDISDAFIAQLRIRTPSADACAGDLSGGNQQKVVLARWLAIRPRVLILDEPTQGVDVGAKAEIHALMTDLAEQGVAIVMISSELPEILGMSDRIAVMRDGRIAGVLSRQEATQQNILHLAIIH